MRKIRTSGKETRRCVFVLIGPTASGKTALSLLLAPRLNAEIISADSRQIYRYMNIGTAKPTEAERQIVPHHFIDELTPDQDFNAGEFGRRGRAFIAEIHARNKEALVVGGSGLYIRALVDGLFEGPSADPELRKTLTVELHQHGAEHLLEQLRAVDPEAAAAMLPGNTRRIIRALEVYHLTGTPLSLLQAAEMNIPFVPVFAGLRWERKTLYERINRRVDDMLGNGLVDEVKKLGELGFDDNLNALGTVGYEEVIAHLNGHIDYPRMVNLIKQNTRRFAKRQMTWFRPDTRIRWFDLTPETDVPALATAIAEYYLGPP